MRDKYLIAGMWIIAALFLPGCSGENNPASSQGNNFPSGSSPTSPSSISFGGLVNRAISISSSPTTADSVNFYLQVNGAPMSQANVYFSGTNIPAAIQVPYNSLIPGPTTTSGPTTLAYYLLNSGWAYQAGATYAVTCVAKGVTAWSSLEAPGDITDLKNAAGAVTQTHWTYPGSNDFVFVFNPNYGIITFSDSLVAPPISIPTTIAYPYSGGVTYQVTTWVANESTTVQNGVSGSYYEVVDNLSQYFVQY